MQLFRGACADGRVRGLRNKQWLECSAVLVPETPTLPRRNIDQARRSVLVLRKNSGRRLPWRQSSYASANVTHGVGGEFCSIARQPPLFISQTPEWEMVVLDA